VQLVLRLLAVLLLLLGGMPLASASLSAACASTTEEEQHSERTETPATTRAPAKGELTTPRLEGSPRHVQRPRCSTRRASTPQLAA
jgi:hypothetical protein